MSGTDWTLTPNLGLYMPVVNADLDMWGEHLNENAIILDTVVQSNTDALAGYLPLAGNATITGPVSSTGVFTFGGTSGTQPALIGAGNGGISYLSLGSIGQNIAFGVSAGSIYLFQNGVNVGGALATQTYLQGNYLPLSGGQLSGPLISWTGTGPTSPGVAIGDNSTGFWRSAPYLFLSVGGAINQEWTGTQSQMSVPLLLAGDATQPLGAVTLRQLEAAGGGASVSVGDTPPPSPSQGDLWFDATDTQLYIQYQDSTSNQWVVANNQSGFVNEAANDGRLYGRQDSQWVPVPTGGGGGGIDEAPQDGNAYMRSNAAWTSGGTVTNDLVLTGNFIVNPPNGEALLYGSTAPDRYMQLQAQWTGSGGAGGVIAMCGPTWTGGGGNGAVQIWAGPDADVGWFFRADGTLGLPADPVAPGDAVTKRYVDANAGGGGGGIPEPVGPGVWGRTAAGAWNNVLPTAGANLQVDCTVGGANTGSFTVNNGNFAAQTTFGWNEITIGYPTGSGGILYWIANQNTVNWEIDGTAGAWEIYRSNGAAALSISNASGVVDFAFTPTVLGVPIGGGGGGGPPFQGITDGSNAAPGDIGEYIITTYGTSNAISITLSAGDWDVWAYMQVSIPASSGYTVALGDGLQLQWTGGFDWQYPVTAHVMQSNAPTAGSHQASAINGPMRANATGSTTCTALAIAMIGGSGVWPAGTTYLWRAWARRMR